MLEEKVKVFILTFLAYASLTSLRYGWSYSKAQLNQQFGVSMKELGVVDAFYVVCYSSGLLILGNFLHKFSLKTYVFIGVITSCLSFMFFPILYSLTSIFNLKIVIIFMSINGFFQATVFPGIMGIFGNWFQKNKKGFLMAIWTMSGYVGNIYASTSCNILEQNHFSWISNFMMTGMLGVVVATLIFYFLQQKPPSLINLAQPKQLQQNLIQQEVPEALQSKYGILSLISLPRVPVYIIGFACLKGCVYGLVFWLPTFLESKGQLIGDQKGYISSMMDIGSLIGATSIGYFADIFDKKALFLSPLLLTCSFLMCMVTYAVSPWQYYSVMMLMGICIGGPYNMICTVITMDIGHKINQKSSVARISSLIEGAAAFASALQMIIIPFIPFNYIFYLFSAECMVATVVLGPLFLEQLSTIDYFREYFAKKQIRNSEYNQSIQLKAIGKAERYQVDKSNVA